MWSHQQPLPGLQVWTEQTYLRVVGLLHLLLVEAELFLVLGSHLDQRLGQLALVVHLPPAVELHHARLVAAFGLTHLLQTQTGLEVRSLRALISSFMDLPI